MIPETIIFSSTSYVVPAGKYAKCLPIQLALQSQNVLSPSPNTWQIDTNVVKRSDFSATVQTVNTPTGVWKVTHGAEVDTATNSSNFATIAARPAMQAGGKAIVTSGLQVSSPSSVNSTFSFTDQNALKEFLEVPTGTTIAGSGTYLWCIIVFAI